MWVHFSVNTSGPGDCCFPYWVSGFKRRGNLSLSWSTTQSSVGECWGPCGQCSRAKRTGSLALSQMVGKGKLDLQKVGTRPQYFAPGLYHIFREECRRQDTVRGRGKEDTSRGVVVEISWIWRGSWPRGRTVDKPGGGIPLLLSYSILLGHFLCRSMG